MKKTLYLIVALAALMTSCASTKSGGWGNTSHEVDLKSRSINYYDLTVDPVGVTYTIDISTKEGRIKLDGLNLNQAKEMVLQEAAMMNNAAKLVEPKFTYLKEGKDILRITVFGFPARYK